MIGIPIIIVHVKKIVKKGSKHFSLIVFLNMHAKKAAFKLLFQNLILENGLT